jgi:hypothetical protein
MDRDFVPDHNVDSDVLPKVRHAVPEVLCDERLRNLPRIRPRRPDLALSGLTNPVYHLYIRWAVESSEPSEQVRRTARVLMRDDLFSPKTPSFRRGL